MSRRKPSSFSGGSFQRLVLIGMASLSPEGAKYASLGQRPRKGDSSLHRALKGRDNSHRYSALSGLADNGAFADSRGGAPGYHIPPLRGCERDRGRPGGDYTACPCVAAAPRPI